MKTFDEKDIEPEKKYRACKTIQEFCELVTRNATFQSDEQRSLYLVGCKVHLRNKENGKSFSYDAKILN